MLPFEITVPAVAVAVMAEPPRSVKSPAEPRIEPAPLTVVMENNAVSAASGRMVIREMSMPDDRPVRIIASMGSIPTDRDSCVRKKASGKFRRL